MDVDDDGRAFSRTILIGLIVARKSETSTDAIWLLESTSFNPYFFVVFAKLCSWWQLDSYGQCSVEVFLVHFKKKDILCHFLILELED